MNTYEISITAKSGLKFIQVIATSLDAAIADLNEAYFEAEIVSSRLVG